MKKAIISVLLALTFVCSSALTTLNVHATELDSPVEVETNEVEVETNENENQDEVVNDILNLQDYVISSIENYKNDTFTKEIANKFVNDVAPNLQDSDLEELATKVENFEEIFTDMYISSVFIVCLDYEDYSQLTMEEVNLYLSTCLSLNMNNLSCIDDNINSLFARKYALISNECIEIEANITIESETRVRNLLDETWSTIETCRTLKSKNVATAETMEEYFSILYSTQWIYLDKIEELKKEDNTGSGDVDNGNTEKPVAPDNNEVTNTIVTTNKVDKLPQTGGENSTATCAVGLLCITLGGIIIKKKF